MSRKKPKREEERPVVETDSYRIWDGRGISPKEGKELKNVCLGIYPGERIHEALVFSLGPDSGLKIVSKEREKDGMIRVLVKVDKSDGTCDVLKLKGWITKAEYDRVVGAAKALIGEVRMARTPGEDFHVGLAHAMEQVEQEDSHVLKIGFVVHGEYVKMQKSH